MRKRKKYKDLLTKKFSVSLKEKIVLDFEEIINFNIEIEYSEDNRNTIRGLRNIVALSYLYKHNIEYDRKKHNFVFKEIL